MAQPRGSQPPARGPRGLQTEELADKDNDAPEPSQAAATMAGGGRGRHAVVDEALQQ